MSIFKTLPDDKGVHVVLESLAYYRFDSDGTGKYGWYYPGKTVEVTFTWRQQGNRIYFNGGSNYITVRMVVKL